jgi:DNA-binding HxlR family transcriptional regulator
VTQAPLVRRSPIPPDRCNLAKTFELIGERWSLLILRAALSGVRRFEDFYRELGAPRSVLSNRLAALVEAGLMQRREYREPGQRARDDYSLTEMGESLRLPFTAMMQWGNRWLGRGKPPLVKLRRRGTKRTVRVELVDDDHHPVPIEELFVELTAAGKQAQRAEKRASSPRAAKRRGHSGVT